jgi:hypothetical protein
MVAAFVNILSSDEICKTNLVTKGNGQRSNYRQHYTYTLLELQNVIPVMLCYVMPVYLWYTQYNKFYQAPQIIQNWFLPKLLRCWRMNIFFKLTPCSKILLKYPPGAHIYKKFQILYGTLLKRTRLFDIQRTVHRDIYILIIKINEMRSFSDLFDKVLCTFRQGPLSIIRRISTLYTRNRYLSC